MTNFTLRPLLAASALTAALCVSAALPADGTHDLFNYRYTPRHASSAFSGERRARIDRASRLMAANRLMQAPAEDEGYAPEQIFGPSNYTGDMDAPGGERWFYTAEYTYDVIPPDMDNGIWFTDYIVKAYRFDIYDADYRHIGTIDAPVDYADDEQRLVNIELAPVATRHFFNTDDKIEIMVGMSVNTITPGMNRYRTVVYSLEDGKSVSEPVWRIESLLSDAIEGPAKDDGRDNFFMVFGEDVVADDMLDNDDVSFWDFLCANAIKANFYGPAKNDTDGPLCIDSKVLPLVQLPGDQESSPYLISHVYGDQVRYMYAYYDEPLWERYDDPIYGEMVQRESNRLNVELFSISDTGLNLEHRAVIDVALDSEDPSAIASFFGVGDMNYYKDLLYDDPDAPEGKPYLVVTRTNYNPSSDTSSASYFLYDHEGKLVRPLSVYCDSTLPLCDIDGCEPQQLFISMEDGEYVFRFVDLYSGEERLSTSYFVDTPDGRDRVMANLDRTPAGDSYKYVFEMMDPDYNDKDDTLVRLLWLNSDGSFDRIERMNLGENVMYAMLYIEGNALQPGMFHSDPTHEYMALIKRGLPGDVVSEELMIAQPVGEEYPDGNTLLLLKADERGALSTIIPWLEAEKPTLTVYYLQGENLDSMAYTQDIYSLPLDAMSGVTEVEGESPVFSVEGSLLKASGMMSVYSLAGANVTEATGVLDLSTLPAGIYVVSCNGASAKIWVK